MPVAIVPVVVTTAVAAVAAALWTPWLKFVLVGCWCEVEPVTNLGGNPKKRGSLGQTC